MNYYAEICYAIPHDLGTFLFIDWSQRDTSRTCNHVFERNWSIAGQNGRQARSVTMTTASLDNRTCQPYQDGSAAGLNLVRDASAKSGLHGKGYCSTERSLRARPSGRRGTPAPSGPVGYWAKLRN